MKVFVTYLSSLLLLLTFMVNSQGVFVEHHNCNNCYDGSCEVDISSSVESENACCESHEHIQTKKTGHCDLSDFSNIEHQSSCTCFAEYIQLPVFYSSVTSNMQVPSESVLFLLDDLSVNLYDLANEYKVSTFHKPPDRPISSCSLIVENCSFLC